MCIYIYVFKSVYICICMCVRPWIPARLGMRVCLQDFQASDIQYKPRWYCEKLQQSLSTLGVGKCQSL